jgi:hypothetical protein
MMNALSLLVALAVIVFFWWPFGSSFSSALRKDASRRRHGRRALATDEERALRVLAF